MPALRKLWVLHRGQGPSGTCSVPQSRWGTAVPSGSGSSTLGDTSREGACPWGFGPSSLFLPSPGAQTLERIPAQCARAVNRVRASVPPVEDGVCRVPYFLGLLGALGKEIRVRVPGTVPGTTEGLRHCGDSIITPGPGHSSGVALLPSHDGEDLCNHQGHDGGVWAGACQPTGP